eukprot:GHVH01015737.1.p1 GENE.GHVH01015737.1~~GHVH01015737.1.p1  ORF type:complete len:420 (+),score=53.43 GHVH01015737.1:164-1423(+)
MIMKLVQYLITNLMLIGSSSAAPEDVYHLESPGFSKVCQEAIAMTAMSKVDSKALSQLKRLLANKDAVDVVDWGNKVAKKYPLTESYHYQTVKYDSNAYDGNDKSAVKCANLTLDNIGNCHRGPCLLDVLAHFYVRLTDPARLSDFPLKYPKDMEFSDVDAIKLVINLLTELHNPMAFSMDGDATPALSHGHVLVNRDLSLKTTTYDLGRGQLCDISSINFNTQWNSGWTHHQNVGGNVYANVDKAFGRSTDENLAMFKQWAVETASRRCTMMDMWRHGFSITNADIERAFNKLVKKELLMAGIRMSVAAHRILDVQKGSALRQAGGLIDVPVDASYGKVSLHRIENSMPNSDHSVIHVFLVNVTIITIVLFVGWYLLVRDPYASDKEAYGSSATGKQASTPSRTSVIPASLVGKDKSF